MYQIDENLFKKYGALVTSKGAELKDPLESCSVKI